MSTLQDIPNEWLREQRRQTVQLIATSGREIALLRTVQQDDGAGGRTPGTAMELAPVRRFFGAIRKEPNERDTIPGTSVRADYVLIGTHTDNIQDGDEFLIEGRKFTVRYVNPEREYQIKALVTSYGD